MPQSHCSVPGKLHNLTAKPWFHLAPQQHLVLHKRFQSCTKNSNGVCLQNVVTEELVLAWSYYYLSSLEKLTLFFQRGKMVSLKFLLDSKLQVFLFALSASKGPQRFGYS